MNNASSASSLQMPLGSSGASKSSQRSIRLLAGGCLALLAQCAGAAPFNYVANYSDSTVSVIDLSTNSVVSVTDPTTGNAATAITVGTNPLGVALNPAGTKAYVANYGSGTVSVIDTSSNTVTASISVDAQPELLAVSPDGNTVYVANAQGNTLSVINATTNVVATKIGMGGFPVGVAVTPSGNAVYVTLANKSQVAVVNTSNNSITTTIPVGINPTGIVVNPAGTFAYVVNTYNQYTNGSVSVIDTSKNTVVATIPISQPALPTEPTGIAISPDGAYIYVTNYLTGILTVISTTTNAVVIELPVGGGPLGVAINSTGAYAYVNNAVSSTISVVDLSSNSVSSTTLAAGTGPAYSAISSASVNLDQHGLTGAWYNPNTTGQGIFLETYADALGSGQGLIGAGWFTYDTTAQGGQRWYSLQGNMTNTSPTASLTIYTATGGNFNAAPKVSAVPVGQATLQFSDCTHGVLKYQFSDGSNRSGFVSLTRLTANATCGQTGDNGLPASDSLLSGSWYDSNTSGQGMIFDINPAQSLLSAAWFTYAPNGQQISGGASQRWYTLQSLQFVPGISSLDGIPIYETSGGVFHDPTPVTTTAVGTAKVVFQSCGAMSINYNFSAGSNQGQSGAISMTRVGPTPAGCSL